MQYNFDQIITRSNTNCIKHDDLITHFGTNDVLPLWVADMDFMAPPCITKALIKRAEHPIYGYTFRSKQCNDAMIHWVENRHHWTIDYRWITSSPGVVTALSLAIQALTSPGDKIAIQPPVYTPFFQVVEDNQRELVCNPLLLKNGQYSMNLDHLEDLAKQGLKMIILSNPHNPVGRVWTHYELEQLGEICIKYDLIVISDEIHCDLTFKGHSHTPLASISQEMAQRTVTCMAPSKTFNVAGLASSVIIIPNQIFKQKYDHQLNALHLNLGNIFGHTAMQAGYQEGAQWLKELMQYLQGNVNFIREFLKQHLPNIHLIEPQGTYLIWLDCRELEMSDDELQKFMITEAKVALNAGNTFGESGNGFLRMNIGCPISLIKEALIRIQKALENNHQ